MGSKLGIGDRVEALHNRCEPTGCTGEVIAIDYREDSGGYMVTVREDGDTGDRLPMWEHEDYFRLMPNDQGKGRE